jgi:hypothetical protein
LSYFEARSGGRLSRSSLVFSNFFFRPKKDSGFLSEGEQELPAWQQNSCASVSVLHWELVPEMAAFTRTCRSLISYLVPGVLMISYPLQEHPLDGQTCPVSTLYQP